MATKSSKYQDIISRSILIRSGSPFIYQLKPKKEEIGSLTRMTVGKRNLNKTNRTILLVGETGSGKSTLINSLVNYTMGVKFEDEVWFQIVDEKERSQSESQTSDVIVYQIFGFEDKTLPYSLTIIDTPGCGDTRGTEQDLIISQRLLDLFRSEDGVHEVNAVGLVMKASDNRLSDRLMYIFDSVDSLFGKDLEKNTVALMTHSDGSKPKTLQALEDMDTKCAKNESNQPVHFLFDNQQNLQRTEGTQFSLESAWKLTEKGMGHFTAFLQKTTPHQLRALVGLHVPIRLTACIHNLEERIKLTELKQNEIKQIQEEMKKNKTFPVEFDEPYKDKQPIDGGMRWLVFYGQAVCCTVCEENCHYPGCTMVWKPEHCEVMNRGHCTSCTNKCPVSAHVKEKWKYVTKTRRVQKTEAEMKQKYEKNKSESEKRLSLVENLEKEMNQLTSEKSQLLDEAYQHVVRLKQIAPNVNSVSTLVHLDIPIEKMEERENREKVQKLEDGTKAALHNRSSRFPSKYDDIISRSFQISSGSPSIYQLKPKKEEIGTLTRMTVGERNMNKTNRTILLVGETGSGKSTLINSLVNYTMGVKFEDEVWFQIVEEEKRSQSESQTSDVIVYQIFGFEDKTLPYSLTIIDTPGYGDTGGIGRDLIINQRLFDLFRSEDGVHEVNAVGLVMKASENRLNDRLMYVLNSVTSLFGKDLEKKIVALMTHSHGRKPKNALQALEAANIKCAKNEKNQPVYFLFNNCQSDERTEEEEEEYLEDADKISVRGMREFTVFLEKNAPQKMEKTVDVLNGRVRLTACIQNLEERIKLTELKQNEIKQIQEALKKHKEQMKLNKNFTVEIDEVYKEKVPIGGGMWGLLFYEGAVCCSVCEENCHYPGCTMVWKPHKCEVMKRGHCTVCTNKCPALTHLKQKWKYVTKTRKVKKTEAEIKQKFEKNKSESENKLSLLENLEKEMNQLTSEKSQLLDEAYQHVVNLEQIALNVDSVSTHVHLDFLIEKTKERGDREKVQKLEEMKNREDDGTRAALIYMKNKLDLENELKLH
ncbi:uncharacterized protein LOC124996228 [Mugil cephalus]|uniref:uncharacterized protein LOC124996228 n=1 Tax=Mugil cephalus TaxID=48193 RepID=UPI001FB75072|nr:uncharacterized protein LOC124996228 [Mugil cephalus]